MLFPNHTNLNLNYELISEIGQGGMAFVYRARRRSDGLICAIKILSPSQNINLETSKKRFDDEIRLTSQISSKYVIKVIDFHYDYLEKYIVMEYINGQTLKRYIKRRGRLSELETLKISTQLLCAVIDIKQHKIFHRDLKSTNILIDNFGSIKVIDFGISLQEEGTRHTEESKVAVSIQYMAPELLLTRTPTEQSEIYAIGILMYEMLVGKTPFEGSDQDVISSHISKQITDVNKIHPNISQSLTNIIIRATAKRPQQRYASFQQMLEALQWAPKNFSKKRELLKNKTTFFHRHAKSFVPLTLLLLVALASLILLLFL